jgi:hypothetical protein
MVVDIFLEREELAPPPVLLYAADCKATGRSLFDLSECPLLKNGAK